MKTYIIKWGESFEPNPALLAGEVWQHPKQRVKTYGCVEFERPTLGEAKDFAMTLIRKSPHMHKFLVHPEQSLVKFCQWTDSDTMLSLQPNLQFIQRKTDTHRFGEIQNGTHFPSYALLELVWYRLYREENAWKRHERHILDRYKAIQLGASRFYPGTLEDTYLQKEPILRHS